MRGRESPTIFDGGRRRGGCLGLGLLDPAGAAAAGATLRFSTWHPPVGREVKDRLAPRAGGDEARERGRPRLHALRRRGARQGAGALRHRRPRAFGHGLFHRYLDPGPLPADRRPIAAAWVDGKDVAAEIGNAVYRRALQAEFAKVKLLELNGCIQSFIWTRRPVSKMADLSGMKLRSPGGHQTHYIKALGPSRSSCPSATSTWPWKPGRVDGIVTCPPLILGYKLHEVARFAAVLTLGCVSEGVAMNLNTWNRCRRSRSRRSNRCARTRIG